MVTKKFGQSRRKTGQHGTATHLIFVCDARRSRRSLPGLLTPRAAESGPAREWNCARRAGALTKIEAGKKTKGERKINLIGEDRNRPMGGRRAEMNRGLSRVNSGFTRLISAARLFSPRALQLLPRSARSARRGFAFSPCVDRTLAPAPPGGGAAAMRAGGRTRRRAVDALVALVVIALVVAVLARARSNDPRRDETRRKSEPRRAGGFERGGEGGGGDDAALRRAGTTETGMGPGDGKRTVGARGARSGDADARVREPRGGGGGGGCAKTRRVGRARGATTRATTRLDGRQLFSARGGGRGGAGNAPTAPARPREGPAAGGAKRATAPGRPGRRRGRGRRRRRGLPVAVDRLGKRFFASRRSWFRRIVRGGVRSVPRVLLLRRRVRRGGGLLRGLRFARDVRRAENSYGKLSRSERERTRKRSAADAGDVVVRR
jgi:hypothetical protein